MGITSAMYSGVSGLNTNSQAMSVIGNNLANTNTLGFKGGRSVFSDMLSSTISGSGGNSQVGRGVTLSKVDTIFSQGTFETTSSNTDVAIEGEGFFLLKEVGSDTTLYSRAGAFRFDEEGYLINPEGFRVQGSGYDQNGEVIPGDYQDIQVANVGLTAAQATTALDMTTNLDAGAEVKPPMALMDPLAVYDPILNPLDPTTYNYSSSTQIFDSLGEPHLLTMYFRKDANNSWDVHYSAEDIGGQPIGNPLIAITTLDFDEQGQLLDVAGLPPDDPLYQPVTAAVPALDFANGSAPVDATITFQTTQFDSASTVISQGQDGYAAGNLTNVGINDDGVVIATYSNGEQTKVAALVLAKFNNPGGLEMVGSNLYQATDSSGDPRSGLPGPELGTIFTNSLEQSNVDMGAEFVKMITVQRGFQANSKIITTVDELLGEVINMKR